MATDGLDFLWLELTNRCNLRCVHCYTDSHPGSGGRDRLTTEDYESLLRQAYALGCRRMQFIGGEPQLHPDFGRLLRTAKEVGFDFVEVFSNLTHLREDTVRFAAGAGIRFATSVYSDDPAVHDAVTQVRSSHARTVGNLGRLVESGVATRAAIIRIDQEPAAIERTTSYLHGLGVPTVHTGGVRGFGRGQLLLGEPGGMHGLCGHCWAGKLCVAPDGAAYACVMAREWTVGDVLASPLAEIVRGAALADVRRAVRRTVYEPRAAAGRLPRGHDGPDRPTTRHDGPDRPAAGHDGPATGHDEPDRPAPGHDGPDRPTTGYPGSGRPETGAAEEAAEPAAGAGGGGSRCGPADREESCVPAELTGCEPLEPCEPDEEQPHAGGSVGCDVIDLGGPPSCPQSCEPDAPPCPQTAGEPCPQSHG